MNQFEETSRKDDTAGPADGPATIAHDLGEFPPALDVTAGAAKGGGTCDCKKFGKDCENLAAPTLASAPQERAAVPDILFDGIAVYEEVMANDPNTPRPTADNVANVLDAVVRLMRRAAPVSQEGDYLPKRAVADEIVLLSNVMREHPQLKPVIGREALLMRCVRKALAAPAAAPVAPVVQEGDQPEPMDTPLPCDVKVGAVTIRKGCKLRTLVLRMESLHRMAMAAIPSDPANASEFWKRVEEIRQSPAAPCSTEASAQAAPDAVRDAALAECEQICVDMLSNQDVAPDSEGPRILSRIKSLRTSTQADDSQPAVGGA